MTEGSDMPDVTLVVRDLDAEGVPRAERSLGRLGFVIETNVDPEKGLVAVSYEGGGTELEKIEEALREAGCRVEPSPGAGEVEG
jgi:copper chaperone CopZ